MSNNVSVVVALWNAEVTIEKCILSIINQKNIDIELIVVDDCSTDRSAEIVRKLQERFSHIKLLKNRVNSGPSISRNNGINASTGDWIAIVDSDDFIAENRLDKMVYHAETHNSDICFDNLTFEYPEADALNKKILISDKNQSLLSKEWDITMYANLNRPYESDVLIGFLKPLIRRGFINEHLIRYPETLKNSEDYLFILKCLAYKAKVIYLHEPSYYYLVNPSSLSGKFDLEAHDKLIVEESIFKEKYKNLLSMNDVRAIDSHIIFLELARTTNLMFLYLKTRNITALFSLMWQDKIHFRHHFVRLLNSLIRKLIRKGNRGR